MNFVYKKGRLTSLTPEELTDIANEAVRPLAPIYNIADFTGDGSRVQKLHCECNGHGEFELLDPGKYDFRRYVQCRLCGVQTAL
jgi:hypothetical protein